MICGHPDTEIHHVFMGSRRQMSDRYGLTVPVCRKCHRLIHAAPNDGLDLALKEEAQKHFEKQFGHDKFLQAFGKSWL